MIQHNKYIDGYIPVEDISRFYRKDFSFANSKQEVHTMADKFIPHAKDEEYAKIGPLRDCFSLFLTDRTIIEGSMFFKYNSAMSLMPNTQKLLDELIEVVKMSPTPRVGWVYVTKLGPGKSISRHSDTTGQYWSDINRFQFYYLADSVTQIIDNKIVPVETGGLYLLDHRQIHEYKNNGNDDLILLIFDLYK